MGLRRDSVPCALLGRSGVGRGRTEKEQRETDSRAEKSRGNFALGRA